MALTNDLVSKFAKLVTTNIPGQNETTVKGTIKEIDGVKYAQFDGSEMLTPVSSTATISDGDRVNILLKNHSAMVTGNATDPSASSWKVGLLDGKFDNLAAKNIDVDNLTAEVAKISTLKADDAIIENIQATAITSDYIEATVAKIGYIKTNELSAEVAKISTLTADDAIIKNIQSTAINADYIRTAVADVGYITADDAVIKGKLDANMANIDHANIDKSQIGLLFLEMGLIDNATIIDGHITGHLDAVEVNANKITAGTLTVDRLLLKDESGNYKMATLNEDGELITTTINGSVITERTINASHIVAESITGNEIAAETITGDKLVAKSITAIKIDVESIFAEDIIARGSITSPLLQSDDYKYTGATYEGTEYSDSGMIVDLRNKIIRTQKFCLTKDGTMFASEIHSGRYYGLEKTGAAFIFNGWTAGSKMYADLLKVTGDTPDSIFYGTYIDTDNDQFIFMKPCNFPFSIYATEIYEGGESLSEQYSAKSHTHTKSQITDLSFDGIYFFSGNTASGTHDANAMVYNGHWYYNSNGPSTALGALANDGALYSQAHSTDWVAQIAQDYYNGRMFVRGKDNGTWTDWKRVALYDEVLPNTGGIVNGQLLINSGRADKISPANQDIRIDGIVGDTTVSGAPGIGFHQPNVNWASIKFFDNAFRFINSNYSGFVSIVADNGTFTGEVAEENQALRTRYAGISHTHTKSQITDFPASLPASDVYAWAKAANSLGIVTASSYVAPTTNHGNTTTGYILFPAIGMAIQWSTRTWVGPLSRAWGNIYLNSNSDGITPPNWAKAFTSEPQVIATVRNWSSGGACGIIKSGAQKYPTSKISPGTWEIWRGNSNTASNVYTVTVIGIGKYT